MLLECFFSSVAVSLLWLIGFYVPPLLILSNLFAPLPLALLVQRQDLKAGFLSLLVSIVLILFFVKADSAVLMLILQAGPVGLLLGLLFKNHVSFGNGVGISCFTATVFTLVALGLNYWVAGINTSLFEQEMRQAMKQIIGLQNSQIIEETIKMAMELIPANLIIWSIITTFFAFLITRQAFIMLGYKVTPLLPFRKWRFPWYIIWGLITGLAFVLTGDYINSPIAGVVGKNFLCISCFLYSIVGLSVFMFFITKWNFSRILKFLVIGIFFLYLPLALSILAVFGMVDSFINLRSFERREL